MKRSLLFPNLLLIAVFLMHPALFSAEEDLFTDDLPFVPSKPRCYIYRVAPADRDGDGDGQEDAFGTFCDMKVLVATGVQGADSGGRETEGPGFALLNRYGDKLRQEGWDVVLVDAGAAFADGTLDDAIIRERVLERVHDSLARYAFPGDIANVLSHLGTDPFAALVAEAPDDPAGHYRENLAEITITREGESFRTGMELKNYNDLQAVPFPVVVPGTAMPREDLVEDLLQK